MCRNGLAHGRSRRTSLADTELAEDYVEDVLDIDPAEQPAERVRGRPQIFRDQFLSLPDGSDAPPQRKRCLLQQSTLTLPRDQRALVRTKKILRKGNHGCDQVSDAVTMPSGNPEPALSRRIGFRRGCFLTLEIDLVAHQPNRRAAIVLRRPFFKIR